MSIDYSEVDGTANQNPIVLGLAWSTSLAITADTDWDAADETVGNWNIRIHPARYGGDPAIEVSPSSATIDGANAKIITLAIALTAAQTAAIDVPDGREAVQVKVSVEHKTGGQWIPRETLRGTCPAKLRPGAAT